MSEENGTTETTSTETVSEQAVDTSQQHDQGETLEAQSESQESAEESNTRVNDDIGFDKEETTEESTEDSLESTVQELDGLVESAMNEELNEEQLKIIEESGLGKYLDMIVKAQQLEIQNNTNEIFSVVGGEESYREMQEWAKHSLPKEERDAYGEALYSGNMRVAKMAVENLHNKFIKANGKAPEHFIQSGQSVNEGSRPYSDRLEYIKETQSREYRMNPDYREQVERKRSLSGF